MTKILTNRIIRGAIYSVLSPAALFAAPIYAQNTAQTPSGEAVEEIVVTGIRESLNKARDIKRDATQFVDAIVADDIGKLPDRNVAESLARVSGVQVDRGIAEGTSVSVRGLRQNVYLFNGRQIVDPTGRGGIGLETLGTSTFGLLALVPSELIARLELTKLASADQISGALGGIIDVQTPMPLDGPNRLGAKVGGIYYDQAQENGYEGFVLASQKFAGDTLGVLVSASYNKRDLSQEGLDTFSGYSRFTDAGGTVRFGHADARPEAIAEERKNLGLNGVLQWQPTDSTEFVFDTFYSELNSDRDRYWLQFTPTAGLTNATYSPNNILLSGTASGPVLTNTEFLDTEADIWSSALRGNFEVTDRLHASAEVAFTESTSSAHQVYFRLQPIVGITPTVNFDFTQGDLGSYQIGGIDLSDPAQLRYTILFDNTFIAESKDTAVRTDWTYDLDAGFFKAVGFGARYDRVDSEQNPLRADIRPVGGIPATALSPFLTTYSNGGFASGEFAGLPRSYLAASSAVSSCAAFGAVTAVSQNVQCLEPRNNTNAFASTFEIKEKFTEGYGKVDFDTQLGASALTGNVGVRFVKRELESIGNQINPTGGATPSTFERSDNDLLPSAVAKLAAGRRLDLPARRGACARVSEHGRPQQRRHAGEQCSFRRRRADGAGHRHGRRARPRSVQGRPGRSRGRVLLRRAGAGVARPVLQGRLDLHRAAATARDLQRRQLPDQSQDQRRRRRRAGRGAAGAAAVLFPPRRVGRLRRDHELLVYRLEYADPGRGRPHPALAGPVAEQCERRRLLRKWPDQRPPRLQLARRLPDRLVSSGNGHL